eukprot:3863435-Amphidinium_carterae.1
MLLDKGDQNGEVGNDLGFRLSIPELHKDSKQQQNQQHAINNFQNLRCLPGSVRGLGIPMLSCKGFRQLFYSKGSVVRNY